MNNLRDKVSDEMKAEIAEWVRKDNIEKADAVSEAVHPRTNLYSRYIKRLIDIVVSLCALIITLPINLIIGVITFFDVGQPIFFSQRRVGKDEKVFSIVKFRNMKNTVDEDGILLPASKRVTKWGKFVRKTSLDELLNFWSVLKGDMSLIGPRPLPITYLPRYSERHRKRLLVRPGLECPPIDIESYDGSWQQRFENDIWYVENISFRTDCLMLLRLVQFTFNRKFAKKRGAATVSSFIGYNDSGKAMDLNDVSIEYVKSVLLKHGIDVN